MRHFVGSFAPCIEFGPDATMSMMKSKCLCYHRCCPELLLSVIHFIHAAMIDPSCIMCVSYSSLYSDCSHVLRILNGLAQ